MPIDFTFDLTKVKNLLPRCGYTTDKCILKIYKYTNIRVLRTRNIFYFLRE